MSMPLSLEALEQLQAEACADDVAIDLARMSLWTEDEVRSYFESGGTVAPESDGGGDEEAKQLKEEGNAKLKLGELDAAIALYRRAAAAGASLPPAELAPVWSNLSMALLKNGEAPAALEAAERCVAAKPAWHKAHFRRGEALFGLRRHADAAAAYREAERLEGADRDIAAARALADEAAKGGVWFRQLLPGRDFAVSPADQKETLIFGAAQQMQNFVYLVGCAHTRECYVVDACWDVAGIAAYAKRKRMRLVGGIGTHYHFDHCGGAVPAQMAAMVAGPFGGKPWLPGLREVRRECGAAAFVHASEVARVAKQCELAEAEISPLQQGQRLPLGRAGELEVLHTPGHSAGSVCICVRPTGAEPLCLMSGDTIFPGSCGRLDLPDSDVDAMFASLAQLRTLRDELAVYPGHAYGGAKSSVGAEKRGGLLRPFSKAEFKRMFDH